MLTHAQERTGTRLMLNARKDGVVVFGKDTYADVCGRMLTYANSCATPARTASSSSAWIRMLTYADVC